MRLAAAVAAVLTLLLGILWLRRVGPPIPPAAEAPPAPVLTAAPAPPPPVAPEKPPSPDIIKPEAPPATESAPPQPDPPALIEYKGRVIAQTMHWKGAPWLQRKTREEEERGGVMRAQLEVKPGQTVCDLGSGDGYHTLWLASQVGETGRVYAVDIQKEMLDMLGKRAAAEGLKNIELVHGKLWDPMLPPNSQDLILLVDVYHEFSHPEHMLVAMRNALKEHGRMALVEFRGEDPAVPIKPEHKMSKEQILKEIPPMGFKLVREFNDLPWQHLMFFEKAEIPPANP